MMHDCPRCGFNQPKDRYCANCGVDIEKLEAKDQPIFQRLFQSTKFLVVLIALIILSLVSFIYISQRQVINQTISQALGGSEIESTAEQEVPVAGRSGEELTANVPEPMESPEVEPENLKQEAVEKKSNVLASKLSFEFAEVPKSLLQELATEGQTLNETQNTKSIFFVNEGSLRELKRKELSPTFLPGGTEASITPETPIRIEFLRFVKGFTSEIGLLMDVDVVSMTNASIELEIQALVSLPGEGGNVATTEYQGRYNFSPSGVLAIAGFVPQQSIRGEAENALSSTPLVIMTSPEFVARSTEFVVFIRAE